MKRIIAFLFIISSICFGGEFKYYKDVKIEECNDILNKLNKYYKVVSYQITPSGSMVKGWVLYYNLIVQLDKK